MELTADALAQLEDMVRRMRPDQGLAHSLDEIKVGKDIQQLVMDQFGELFAKHFPPGMLMELALALEKAERKHPVFAEGVYQALGAVNEEMGELAQSVNHSEPQERIDSEAMDLLVTVWRFVRNDWKMTEDEEQTGEGSSMSKTKLVFEGLTESEKELLEEFRYELAADRRYNPTIAKTPAEGIVRLSNAIGRIADAYEEKDGDLMEMHDEAVVLMALAFRFALTSWEDD